MDVLSAAESHFKATLDKSAFNINICLKNQGDPECLQKLLASVKSYNLAKSNIDTVIGLKNLINQQENTAPDEN